jgi:LDH2 family malate/lactate/ureidoglycolate dehydrogenase
VKTSNVRTPVAVVHETPVSALVDGGNNVGYVAVYRGAEIAVVKAEQNGIAAVGVYNSYFSGRNAYYLERIVSAGLVGLHIASGAPHIVAIQATPRRSGVQEIRIPSQRAFRECERRRVEGILVDRAVISALEAL